MLGPSCKQHFSIQQFNVKHKTPITFIVSQWQNDKSSPNLKYLVYRVVVALLFFITWILGICEVKVKNPPPGFSAKWLIYLTNWGYTTCTVQALLSAGMLAACVMATRLRSLPNLSKNALKLYKVYWITNTIATAIAFGITTMYWTVIYDAKVMDFDAMNYLVHANNSVLMMIDLWIVAHPIRILHFLYPAIFGVIYATFSVIFYLAGGTSREGTTYIYKILDWNKPGTTIVICLAVMAFLIIIHVFNWGVHKLRIKVHEKVFTPTPPPISEESAKGAGGYDNEGMATIVV